VCPIRYKQIGDCVVKLEKGKIEKIKELRKKVYSYHRIARELGISSETAHKRLGNRQGKWF